MRILEDLVDRLAYFCIFVGNAYRGPMVEVRAARQLELIKQRSQDVFLPQGVNQCGLLPVAQELQVDAQIFF